MDEDIGKNIVINNISDIRTKFSTTPPIEIKEFQSIFNIEYLEYQDTTRFSKIYDKLMSNEVFAVNYKDLDHKAIFEEYESFNREIANRINKACDEDDLVVINDSCLLLIPEMIKCRIAFRNLKFNHSFIERLPYYSRIMKCLFIGQKFFYSICDYESFNMYCDRSFEFAGCEIGGCWFLKPYVDNFMVMDTLEHFKCYFKCMSDKGDLNSDRFDENIMKKIVALEIPKERKSVLATVFPINIEAFLKKNIDTNVRYLENFHALNESDHKTLLYLRSKYRERFEIIEATTYSEVIVELLYCNVYAGDHYCELARYLRKEVVNDSFDTEDLSNTIESKLQLDSHKPTEHLLSEEEYIKEFMRINGYDIEITSDMGEDELIEKHLKETYKKIGLNGNYLSKNTTINLPIENVQDNMSNKPLYSKKNESEQNIFYCKKKDLSENFEIKLKLSDPKTLKVVTGFGTYNELINKKKHKSLEKFDIEKFKTFWETSNKIILADYDGTLSEITTDPMKAFPTPRLNKLFKDFAASKKARLIICTGRSKITCDEWFPKEIEVYAEHGAIHRLNGEWTETCKIDCLDKAEELIRYYIDRVPNTIIETKSTGISFHYRQASTFDPSVLYGQLRRIAGKHVTRGKDVVEVKSSSKDKVCEVVKPALVLGDDVTDEDMFRVNDGIGIRVGQGTSYANCYLDNIPDLLEILFSLIE